MENKIEIYQTDDGRTEVEVRFDGETVWLNRNQLAILFGRDIKTIGKHINNIIKQGELAKNSVIAKFATTASDGKTYSVDFYNLDMIISVGYRVNSQQGTQFRIWATKILKDYLLEGYAFNTKRLEQKDREIIFLKDGIKIINRAIEGYLLDNDEINDWLTVFSKGLKLLDDYDNKALDFKGKTIKETIYPNYDDYMNMVQEMYSNFKSSFFALSKDDSFHSSINQIRQSFGDEDLYLSIEEKAANLLYFIVKNHSFVDGNKRIAAACFLLFLEKNNMLKTKSGTIISNATLAALTLYIAISKPEESETVKQIIISVLNRNQDLEE